MDFGCWGPVGSPGGPASGASELNLLNDTGCLLLDDIDEKTLQVRPTPIAAPARPPARAGTHRRRSPPPAYAALAPPLGPGVWRSLAPSC